MKVAGVFKGWDIGVTSSGNCSNRNNPNCTSFDGLKQATLDGMVSLAKASPDTKFVVTGGTEVGHAGACDAGESGTHGCGDKLDLAANASTNQFYQGKINGGEMIKVGTIEYGGRSYNKYTLTLDGQAYTIIDETGAPRGDHWDVRVGDEEK